MKKQTWQQWARLCARDPNTPSRLRKDSLAPLTGTDVRALDAFVSCLQLYTYCDHPERAVEAARIVLGEMQDSTRWIARELIPFTMNWEDRERLWPLLTFGFDDV